ncbi:MAG: DUF924 family protein [Prochloraceae cyanobacterium]|nr:DUF924 family protein [Prochloraceae cyanobacterium]
MSKFQEILSFWFGQPEAANFGKSRKIWFAKNEEFDREIRSRFLTTYQQAVKKELDLWQNYPQNCLALIIVLDQFPRNMFRNTPQAFATDDLALKFAKNAVDRSFDRELLPVQRWFMYLPFEHSENLESQKRSLELFNCLENNSENKQAIASAQRHYKIIEQFGRFPHRNQILGRESTAAEIEFLKTPGSSF